ncbi:MAG TPA: NAD(P)-dependent oxidoreductase [Burkholderiaceae bacterium]|mgnify:CR=1 FL=1|nr:NAD(P)-dependent oxidoreductase [Burkholderiaceae bacterium]
MTICVTGGAGFIGKPLVDALVKSGHVVHVLTRHTDSHKQTTQQPLYYQADLTCVEGDLQDFLKDAHVLYHCAGEIKNEAVMQSLHVHGTQRLLEAVRAHMHRTQQTFHWVQLSSVGAYGPPLTASSEARVVTEDTLTQPEGVYESTKTQSDELVMRFAENEPMFSYTILRPSIVIAKDMPNGSVRALTNMMRRGLFFYIGTRTAIANYVHLNDVIDALLLCGNDSRARGHTFNLSNDCLWADIVTAVKTKLSKNLPMMCIPELPLRWLVGLMPSFVKSPLTKERIDVLTRHTSYPANKLKAQLNFVPAVDIPTVFCQMLK